MAFFCPEVISGFFSAAGFSCAACCGTGFSLCEACDVLSDAVFVVPVLALSVPLLLLDPADAATTSATRPAGMMTRFFLYQGRAALAYALAALASAVGLGRLSVGCCGPV